MNPVTELRRRSGLSQRQFARRVGTSQPTIAAYESGAKSPTVRTLSRLARAAGTDAVVTLVPPLTREDRRSLHLHSAIAEHLRRAPDTTLSRAVDNLDRMAAANPGAEPLLDAWREILTRTIDEIIDVLLDPRPKARELRQVTPFGGILSAADRTELYAAFRRQEAREDAR